MTFEEFWKENYEKEFGTSEPYYGIASYAFEKGQENCNCVYTDNSKVIQKLEREAEEYANNWKINKNSNLNFAELLDLRAVIYQAHKDGAEYGYEQGIAKLRYCCTCKKWKECKVVSMYGICADWEIKESE